MISIETKVEGMDELLRRIPDDAKRKAVANRLIGRAGMRTVHAAMARAPRRTGNLQRNIVFVADENAMEGRVSANVSYAAWVETGTGLFGPRHARIDVGHVMRWPVGASGVGGFAQDKGPGGSVRLTGVHTAAFSRSLSGNQGWAFARSTAGMEAQPFMEPGWEDAQAGIAQDVESAQRELLGGEGE